MKTKNYIVLLFLLILSNNIFAQAKKSEVLSKNSKGKANFIKLNETKVPSDITSIKDFLKKQYTFNNDVNYLQKENSLTIENNIETQKLQQHYKGIKVEFSELVISSKNNTVKSINGNNLSIENLSINPNLSESEALNSILNKINSQLYAWQSNSFENLLKTEKNNSNATYFPKGELVIIDKDLYDDVSEPILAYKFDIYSLKPLSRSNYYINASNGELILKDAIIKHVQGPADTRYSGTRTIETEQVGSNFRLRDNTRGNGVNTLNANHVFFDSNGNIDLSGATDFIDSNNNWTATEYNNSDKDNAALDAHWGAEMTYDYFLQSHNRNSIDNNGYELWNYIHVGNNWQNAAWDGERMLYGDDGSTFDILTSLDVIGHEIGHGFCSNTANLLYQNESGAINEGLSDIWGAMVEFNAAPEKDTYLIGEEIILTGLSLRSMLNPNSGFSAQPDTYQGDFWHTGSSDNGGVHTNSGVMNFWFYLLAEGGSGINDNGDVYDVAGINKAKAANIVYRAESVYFTSTTNYQQARDLTIQASDDLYGENSGESFNVINAWYAVGIGNEPMQVSHFITGPTQLTPGYRTFYRMNPYTNATNYVWSIPSGCHYHYCWGITQGQGTNVLGIKAGKTGIQDITCTIYNGSTIIGSQYITVNVQNPYGGGGGGGNSDPCGGIEMINGVIYPPEPCDDDPYNFVKSKNVFKHILVYDFSGRKVIELHNVENFNIDFLSSGLYILKMELSNNEIITKKIIK